MSLCVKYEDEAPYFFTLWRFQNDFLKINASAQPPPLFQTQLSEGDSLADPELNSGKICFFLRTQVRKQKTDANSFK